MKRGTIQQKRKL